MTLPYLILEIANTYNGNFARLKETVRKFAELPYDNYGVKFQPFHFDSLALSDYHWYETYTRLALSEDVWQSIIQFASEQVGDVWLDIFDCFGTMILQKNRQYVRGIKLQASVLGNYEVFTALQGTPLGDTKMILNIAGYEIAEISRFLERFRVLGAQDIILQLGFQSYPTSIEDTSLSKIDVLKEQFPAMELCYADHIDATDTFSYHFPVYAYLKGCRYIEKHICFTRAEAKFDYFSALEFNEACQMVSTLTELQKCLPDDFIVPKEREYLSSTIQKPILKQSMLAGELVNMTNLLYRRTAQEGLTFDEIMAQQKSFYVLAHDKPSKQTLNMADFKKAKIGVIVACRMKSSRLSQKAILSIDGMASVERCLESCLRMSCVDEIILATSTCEDDAVLANYTLNERVKFWQGDPDDVISRYVGACDKYGIDVFVRVTADCPFVSSEIASYLLRSHFAEGADYTGAKDFAVGTSSEIYNVAALKRVLSYLGRADYSEYMTWYMKNNAEIFKVNTVVLPDEYVRNYRLTLDYQEDLDLFRWLYAMLRERKLEMSLTNVFRLLDENPEMTNLNQHLTLTYKTDHALIEKLNRVTKISISEGK